MTGATGSPHRGRLRRRGEGEPQPRLTHHLALLELPPAGGQQAGGGGELLIEDVGGLSKEATKLPGLGIGPRLPWIALRLQQPPHQSPAPCIGDDIGINRVVASTEPTQRSLHQYRSLQQCRGDEQHE